jgi:hypothetical protein
MITDKKKHVTAGASVVLGFFAALAVQTALIGTAPPALAEPTYGEGAELVEEVRDRGILEHFYDSMVVDTLRAICDSASGLAPYGYGADDLARIFMDDGMNGLSYKDAKWLIDTALPKCD